MISLSVIMTKEEYQSAVKLDENGNLINFRLQPYVKNGVEITENVKGAIELDARFITKKSNLFGKTIETKYWYVKEATIKEKIMTEQNLMHSLNSLWNKLQHAPEHGEKIAVIIAEKSWTNNGEEIVSAVKRWIHNKGISTEKIKVAIHLEEKEPIIIKQ